MPKEEVADSNPVEGTTSVALRNLITWGHFNFLVIYFGSEGMKLLRVTSVCALINEVEPGC